MCLPSANQFYQTKQKQYEVQKLFVLTYVCIDTLACAVNDIVFLNKQIIEITELKEGLIMKKHNMSSAVAVDRLIIGNKLYFMQHSKYFFILEISVWYQLWIFSLIFFSRWTCISIYDHLSIVLIRLRLTFKIQIDIYQRYSLYERVISELISLWISICACFPRPFDYSAQIQLLDQMYFHSSLGDLNLKM